MVSLLTWHLFISCFQWIYLIASIYFMFTRVALIPCLARDQWFMWDLELKPVVFCISVSKIGCFDLLNLVFPAVFHMLESIISGCFHAFLCVTIKYSILYDNPYPVFTVDELDEREMNRQAKPSLDEPISVWFWRMKMFPRFQGLWMLLYDWQNHFRRIIYYQLF